MGWRVTWLCFLVLMTGSASAVDEGRSERTRELRDVQKQIRSVQESVNALKSQKSSLTEQLADIERQYGELAQSLRVLDAQSRAQKQQVGALKLRKKKLLDGILRQNRSLVGQLRAAYANGKQEWLKLALNQEDPARLSRVLAYFGYFNRARLSQLQILDQNLASTRELETQLMLEMERLQVTGEKIRQARLHLDESRQRRRQLMAELDHALKDQGGKLKQLQEDAQRLQALIASLPKNPQPSSPNMSKSDGQAAEIDGQHRGWPVEGPLLARFGSPRLSGQWDGVLIGAQEGAPVRAVAPGRVVFSNWLRGYGLLTIIDHGAGYLSLYAFNQTLHKRVGESVEADEIIANVGSSGGQGKPALYFGVREHGRPINPLQWSSRVN